MNVALDFARRMHVNRSASVVRILQIFRCERYGRHPESRGVPASVLTGMLHSSCGGSDGIIMVESSRRQPA
jgi:hypothetical protein